MYFKFLGMAMWVERWKRPQGIEIVKDGDEYLVWLNRWQIIFTAAA